MLPWHDASSSTGWNAGKRQAAQRNPRKRAGRMSRGSLACAVSGIFLGGGMKRWLWRSACWLLATPVLGQDAAAPAPADTVSPVKATAYLRERTNATQWFAATPNAEVYGHQDSLVRLAIEQRVRRFDYQLELLNSAELALPDDAVSPVAAQGQLGLGGTYYAANGKNQYPAAASFKQGFLRYHFRRRRDADAVRLGRFEFLDGQETAPKNTALAWLQNNRIQQRLVGNFGFSNGQRSFDGADAKLGGENWEVTAMAGRAVQGVFNMNANPELNVDIQYLAFTRYLAKKRVLVRGFALGYHDGRTGLLKTDNRPLAARQVDHTNIRIGSYGMDAAAAVPVGRSTVDLLFWGVLQSGRWGVQDQASGAFAVEGGYRLTGVRTQPWLRGGAFRATGDTYPTDGTHNTFFQVLPTPRVYARFPYFNQMNSTEQFVQFVDKPAKKVDVRSDIHFLQLTSASDLWYQGGGAYDTTVFGYTGRPANGHGSFSTLADVSLDYAVTPQVSFTTYYAHSFGKSVVAAIYPRERDANYGYFELNYRWSRLLGRGRP